MEGGKLAGLIGLVLAAAALVVPVAWDVYKSSAALEVQMIGLDKLVEPQKVDKLEIRYDGKVIPGVSRMTLLIINTGRTELRPNDFTGSIVLKLPEKVRLLDFSLDEKRPADLEVQHRVCRAIADAPKEDKACKKPGKPGEPAKPPETDEVHLQFRLLNPKDYARVSLLTAGHAPSLRIGGHVARVSKVEFFDRTKDYEGGRRKIPGSVFFIGLYSLAMLFAGFSAGLPPLQRASRTKEALKSGRFGIPALRRRDDYLAYVAKELDFIPRAHRDSLKQYLGDLPGQMDDANRAELDRRVKKAIEESVPQVTPFLITGGLGLAGLAYVVVTLLWF